MAITPLHWGRQLADWRWSEMNFLSLSLRLLCMAATVLFLGAVGAEVLCAQSARQNPNSTSHGRHSSAGEGHVLPLQGDIFMLGGGGDSRRGVAERHILSPTEEPLF